MAKSRKEHRKQLELEEARKAGLAPAEVDEDGKEINPHIPQYISSAPWYLNSNNNKPSLKHQRKWKSHPNTKSWSWYNKSKRGEKGFQADKFRKGCCANCGAMTHDAKSCMDRPRKVGAKWTGKHIAPDEIIAEEELVELDFDGKRDRWNGFDPASYAYVVVHRYEAMEEARRKNNKTSDDDDQDDFAKVGTTGGGVRNLRSQEDDIAKYLLNLDVNSAYYDPKTRSMREDPLPNADPSEKLYAGDNQNRLSGQALEFQQLNLHLHAFDRGQGGPSQAELLYKDCKVNKEKLKSHVKDTIMEKYGNQNAATEEAIPRELLLGQTDRQLEYDRAGRII